MKIPTPRWYDNLSNTARNTIDQIAHVALGAGLAIIHPALSAWVSFLYEFYIQWPIDRPRDTRMDQGFWFVGMTIGTIVRAVFF